MDWDADYYTFSDTNIEYIWRFLKVVHERGWLYQGHRSTQWCPRCGTSISQHELLGRVPGARSPVALRPLPAEAAARASRSSSGRRRRGRFPRTSPQPSGRTPSTGDATASGTRRAPTGRGLRRGARGEELVGLPYHGPFDDLPALEGVEHRVIPWDDVSLDEGHGHRPHRARARAPRTSSWPACTTCRCSFRSTSPGCSPATARSTGSRPTRPRTPSSRTSRTRPARRGGTDRPPLSRRAGAARRRSSSASSTTGSSRPRRSGSRCSTRTRRSSGRPPSTRSGWTTGCATWATGTSRASGTSACRSRSTRAPAAT